MDLQADKDGVFHLENVDDGEYTFLISLTGYQPQKQRVKITKNQVEPIRLELSHKGHQLNDVEIFGERDKAPKGLETITRLPLKPSDQIQSISVISAKLIEEQGALTITDAVKNVTGVTLFGSYGNVRESMSTRGYRGVPVLINGVRMDSDFRTGSAIVDMQGVESMQVLKGSAAITQGIGNDLGAAGGVINVATKTPKFYNGGEVGLRFGSWGQVRPTFDIQTVLDKKQTAAFRLNGAFERRDSYRPTVGMESAFINPSFAWKPNKRTSFVAELQYLNKTSTPDRGTVNLAADSVEALYDLPFNRFLGFSTDQALVKNLNYSLSMNHELTKNLSIRAVYFKNVYNSDQSGAGTLSTIRGEDFNIRSRSITRALKEDINSTFQLDLVGKNVATGSVRHTFNVGFDFRQNNSTSTAYNSLNVDTINVLQDFTNTLPANILSKGLTAKDPVLESSYNYGFMAQDVARINQYLMLTAGLRYSFSNANTQTAMGNATEDNVDPLFGMMVSPWKNVNFFASYTQTTSLRSASNIQLDRVTPVGASRSKQFEAGVKSDWLENRLRFNFTYFNILNSNLSYSEYDSSGTATGYYGLAGDLRRQGIETEITGRILPNLQVLLGYAYVDAQYKNSPAYVDGSAPMNTPKHTANAWAQYIFNKGALKNLSVGVGVYYVGDRPVNEYTQKVIIHNTTPGMKPFDMPAYTTLNAQIGYTYQRITARVFANNITDAVGYNSYYRGGYINRIDPKNFGVALNYKF